MAKSRHKGAFIFGSILGGAVGAIEALWNAPQSGAQLRRKLGFESEVAHNVTSAAQHAASSAAHVAQSAKPLPGKALGLVEQATAPLVGVKLGHTANNSQPAPSGNATPPEPDTTRPDVTSVMPQGSK